LELIVNRPSFGVVAFVIGDNIAARVVWKIHLPELLFALTTITSGTSMRN